MYVDKKKGDFKTKYYLDSLIIKQLDKFFCKTEKKY